VKYTVVWSPEAEQKLAGIWLAAEDRDAIAKAANVLDGELSQRPSAIGESRPGGRRIAYCLPLGIQFEMFEADRLVRVLTVWRCPRPVR
jgi:hypothetical protein